MSDIPTEDEIRKAAAELGLADANGNYRQSDRNRIARAVQLAKQEQAKTDEAEADADAPTTAEQLARFREDLGAQGINDRTAVDPLLVEVARHILRSQGLRLAARKETTPS